MLAIVAVTKRGLNNAIDLSMKMRLEVDVFCTSTHNDLPKESYRPLEFGLSHEMASLFKDYDALILVMASGIAVRTIAPYIKSKLTDPAVVVMDEEFKFAISLLSGHVGGANDLAKEVSRITGAIPVITTATDIQNLPAFDVIGKKNNCFIENPETIKTISGALLNGEKVVVICEYPIQLENSFPETVEVVKSYSKEIDKDVKKVLISWQDNLPLTYKTTLVLRPKILHLGMGFRKDSDVEYFKECFKDFMQKENISANSIASISTIDIKKEDSQLHKFAQQLGVELKYFSKDELAQVEGDFVGSHFVKSKVGTACVCEPCAFLASGRHKRIVGKTRYKGLTFAIFGENFHLKV